MRNYWQYCRCAHSFTTKVLKITLVSTTFAITDRNYCQNYDNTTQAVMCAKLQLQYDLVSICVYVLLYFDCECRRIKTLEEACNN